MSLNRMGAVSLFLLGLWGEASAASFPRYGGWLRVGIEAAPTTEDPAQMLSWSDFQLGLICQAGLVALGSNGEIQPALAERWEESPDGLSWRFWIQKDATFWDGTRVTAMDIKASLQRVADSNPPSPWGWMLDRVVRAPGMSGLVAEGEDVLRIDLSLPDPGLLGWLAQPPLGVVTQTSEGLIGAGPFRRTAGSDGDWILTRRQGGPAGPYVDQIQLIPIPEAESRFMEFELRELDAVLLDSTEYQKLIHDVRWRDCIQTASVPGRTLALLINTKKTLLSEMPIRQSLRGSVDLDKMMEELLAPLASVPQGACLMGWACQSSGQVSAGTDSASLKSALYGRSLPGLKLWVCEGDSGIHRVAERIQLDLSRSGTAISLVNGQRPGPVSGWMLGGCDFALVDVSMWGWVPGETEEGLGPLLFFLSSDLGRLSGVSDSLEIRELLNRARGERDPEKRGVLCEEAGRMLLETATYLPLVSTRTSLVCQPWVRGILGYVNGLLSLKEAWICDDRPAPGDETP